jgi:allophanate hydrolase
MSLDLLALPNLTAGYRGGSLQVSDVVTEVLRRIEDAGEDHVWISRAPERDLLARATELQRVLDRGSGDLPPLFGVPFAVKDSIDVAGLPTTVACPAFSYEPASSATIVQRLLAGGAICVGKTNLDQFASGLVGVRTPFGVSRNPFDERYIPGGSSSGSAVAVSSGLVSFALGTDAAGSGRVPAAFTNVVGLKPTRGLLSCHGCVPACRSIDCPSILAPSVGEAWRIMDVVAGFDAADPYSRDDRRLPVRSLVDGEFRFAVPRREDLFFDGDLEAERLFDVAVERLQQLGGRQIAIDFEPFRAAAALLYDGPWVANRLYPLEEFLAENGTAVHPVTRAILTGGARYSATEAYASLHELQQLKARAARALGGVEALVVPTTPTIYTIDQVLAEPFELNRRLGYYTNFVNLLDLAAVAVPNGLRSDGLPAGITFIGPAFEDATLATLGRRFHLARGGRAGAANQPASDLPISDPRPRKSSVTLAVVGAHLSGEPLNWQLQELGGALVARARTAPEYRLVALNGAAPPRPGLYRSSAQGGGAIEVELWSLSVEAFGQFVSSVPPPLAIGTIRLEDGTPVKGFLCEEHAAADGRDITHLGGWRNFEQRALEVSM